MKVLIIALDSQIRDALEAQLDNRCRAYRSVGVEWLMPPASKTPVPVTIPPDIDVVVNVATLQCLQQRAVQKPLEALRQLIKACRQANVPLMQLSDSQVFDGTGGGRHREDEELLAASKLGRLLVKMEEQLQAYERHIVLRTGPLFSGRGDDLLTRLLPRLEQPGAVSLAKNGKCCPLHVTDLARVVSAIIDQLSCGCEAWGVYHYSSTEPVSSYQFAETVLAVVSQYRDAGDHSLMLEPADASDPEWQRPLLNCEKILDTFGIKQLPWRTFIVPTVQALFEQQMQEKQ